MSGKKQLEERFNVLSRGAFDKIVNEPNPSRWLKDALEGDLAVLESVILSLETEEVKQRNGKDHRQAVKRKQRRDLLLGKGITQDTLLEALWDSVAEGDNIKLESIKSTLSEL